MGHLAGRYNILRRYAVNGCIWSELILDPKRSQNRFRCRFGSDIDLIKRLATCRARIGMGAPWQETSFMIMVGTGVHYADNVRWANSLEADGTFICHDECIYIWSYSFVGVVAKTWGVVMRVH
ncbi:hypothetical protein QG37_05781 [Candidozyma auris]|nr:hypothetical protein QG37_05781 [[Candida] auris]